LESSRTLIHRLHDYDQYTILAVAYEMDYANLAAFFLLTNATT
jgi:hypothetical protein